MATVYVDLWACHSYAVYGMPEDGNSEDLENYTWQSLLSDS